MANKHIGYRNSASISLWCSLLSLSVVSSPGWMSMTGVAAVMPQEGASWRDRNMYFSKLRNHCHSTSFKSLVFASPPLSLSYLVSPPSWHHFLFCVHVESASFRKHYEVCALLGGWEEEGVLNLDNALSHIQPFP